MSSTNKKAGRDACKSPKSKRSTQELKDDASLALKRLFEGGYAVVACGIADDGVTYTFQHAEFANSQSYEVGKCMKLMGAALYAFQLAMSRAAHADAKRGEEFARGVAETEALTKAIVPGLENGLRSSINPTSVCDEQLRRLEPRPKA